MFNICKVNKIKNNLIKKEILARQDYLVVQANDFAKAFGNLSITQHKLLDFVTSYIKSDSSSTDLYTTTYQAISKHLGYNDSGATYKRISKEFDKLSSNMLFFYINDEKGTGIAKVPLFDYVAFRDSGNIEFSFSNYVTPYLIDLKKHYYSFHLSELATVKHKYTLVLMKLYEANNKNKNKSEVTINGTTEDYQRWFLGDKNRRPNGVFKSSVLMVAINEFSNRYNKLITLQDNMQGRKTAGYTIYINDKDMNI